MGGHLQRGYRFFIHVVGKTVTHACTAKSHPEISKFSKS
jgi:hypothetical protein